MTVRLVRESDVTHMLQIYRPVVERTATSFEYQVPTKAEFWSRISDTLQTRPWLICEINGVVAGYAYASQHRIRSGYDWCSEVSVYVGSRFRRRKVGRALYTALLEILGLLGYRNAYAVITVPNPSSIEFHRQMGFRFLTLYPSIGYKLGSWHDVEWWQVDFPISEPVPSPMRFLEVQELAQFQNAITKGSTVLGL